jgi:hypothetical protein
MLNRAVFVFVMSFLLVMIGSVGASAQNTHQARPGSINYVEGKASIGAQALRPDSAGSAQLDRGQTLTTEAGKVEVLLTPGVFLRLADNSSVRMVSPDLVNTEVAIEKGRAAVEVLDIHKENNIRISLNDTSTKVLNKGLYEFDVSQNQVRVFKGKAEVYVGTQKVTLTSERELTLNIGGKLKAQNLDTRKYEDDFFRWSALRSGYLSEASADEARVYVGAGPGWYGPAWYGPGWYWDPNFLVFTFLPADGIFYSPFGWGFYSPIVVYRSPFFYGFYGHGPHVFNELHYPYGHGFEPPGGFHGGGFHGLVAPGRGRR